MQQLMLLSICLILWGCGETATPTVTATTTISRIATANSDPDVALDASGKGLAVWSEYDGSHYQIQAAWLPDSTVKTRISNGNGDASFPQVAFDNNGNALAIWVQYENGRNDVWAGRYSATAGTWGTPLLISANNALADAGYPDIGVDGAGNAVAVWYQGSGATNHFDIYASQYAVASGSWSSPVKLNDPSFSAFRCQVAVNAAGKALVVWSQSQSDGSIANAPQDVWSSSGTTSGSWGSGVKVNSVSGALNEVYGQVAVAMDSTGNGAALWVQSDTSGPFVIHAARFLAAGSQWQASTVITSSVDNNCYGPHLAFAANGNAVAVWHQQTATGVFTAANRYTNGVGWGSSANISGTFELADTGGINQNLAVDGRGNATAIWAQQTMAQNLLSLYTNRLTVGSGWGTPQLVGTAAVAVGEAFAVVSAATTPAGQTYLVWGLDYY